MTTEATPGRVTLDEIAAQAGVSRAAASLALRGKAGVGDQTRERILGIASELGYRLKSNAVAAASIGLLVKSRPIDIGTTNAFYAPVIAGVSRACAELDLDLRLDSLAVDDQFDPVEVPRLIQAADVDGLIILGAYLSEPTAAMLGNQPVVLVDGYSAEPARFSSIVSDNAGGSATATQHLISLGHRRIAMAGTSPTSFPSLLDRRRGYTSAIREAGLEPIYIDGVHEDPEACAAAVSKTLAKDPTVTAVVAANDAVALAVLAELRDRVPTEVSVIGFDDIEAASLIRPRLDTVAIDKQAMGRLAVSMIRHRIANPSDPAFTVVQAAALVLRETSSAITE